MTDMDGFSERDSAHLPRQDHTEWVEPKAPTTQETVADFLAANDDWREYARGWGGL